MGLRSPDAELRAWEWEATGTVWRIHHDGCVTSELAQAVSAAVERDEALWSRFRPTSDVARINAAAGSHVEVCAETVELLVACTGLKLQTGGVFDPLVGGALEAWGYVRGLQHRRPHVTSSPAGVPADGEIDVDVERGTAAVPADARLDLGGIAKGWIADRAARLLREEQPAGRILVDAGGDLVAVGGTHLVAVEGDPPGWFPLDHGQAIATSGWQRRSWHNGDGRRAHHLIDPTTGAPGVRSLATVAAESAAVADVLAKALALRPGRLARLGVPARVRVAGTNRTNSAWDARAGADGSRRSPPRARVA